MKKSDSLPSTTALRGAQLIERLGRLLRADDHAAGLNPAQTEALGYLARANRFSRTPAALAEYLGSTRGTISQTLIALEAKGLLDRQTNARDGRSVVFSVTKAGSRFLQTSPVRELATAIDHTGKAADLADTLESALRTAIILRGRRAFGTCQTCLHFRRDQSRGATPHHCALLDEPLREADAVLICAEEMR